MLVGLELVEDVVSKCLFLSEYDISDQPCAKRSRHEVKASTKIRVCHVLLPSIDNSTVDAAAALVDICEQHGLHYYIGRSCRSHAVIWKSTTFTENVSSRYYYLP